MALCLFYDLCVPRLVNQVFGPSVFGASGDADAEALADPLMRSLPDMRAQLAALLPLLKRVRGLSALMMMPPLQTSAQQQRLAITWLPLVEDVVHAGNAHERVWSLRGWAQADLGAYAVEVRALYTALVAIRDARGPQQGISLGLPPSLRLTRLSTGALLLEPDDEVERPQPPDRGDAARLYEWCSTIIQRHGDAFWPRLYRYIAFVEVECHWCDRIMRMEARLLLLRR